MSSMFDALSGYLGGETSVRIGRPLGTDDRTASGATGAALAKPATGLVGRLLDSDGDGDVDAGDLARKGAGLLGKFLG